MKSLKNYVNSSLLALSVSTFTAVAEAPMAACSCTSDGSIEDNFQTGWHELTLGGVDFVSNVIPANNRPNMSYAVGYVSAGYMITKPGEHRWYRGSLEVAPEIFAGGVYYGPGSYVAGATLWFRYNFVQPGWKFVPYIQLGGGGTSLDIPHSYDGKDFNFNLDAAVGLHYFIKPTLALNAEYRFQHISNADLWDHNVGVNTSGPSLGVSWFF